MIQLKTPTSEGTQGAPRVLMMADVGPEAANPYARLWVEAARMAGVEVHPYRFSSLLRVSGRTVLHLQWPETRLQSSSRVTAAIQTLKLLLVCAIARIRRFPIVYTVHNLRSHEQHHPTLERLLWWSLSRLVSGLVFLSHSSRELLYDLDARWRRLTWWVVRHGLYDDPRVTRKSTSSPQNILMIGRMRSYKQPDQLLTAFMDLEEISRSRLRLILAGAWVDEDVRRKIENMARDIDKVILMDGPLKEMAMWDLLFQAKVLVMTHSDTLNSGVMMLGLSAGVPVLAPRSAGAEEMHRLAGSDRIRLFTPPLSSESLTEAIQWAGSVCGYGRRIKELEWEVLAPSIGTLYREILSPRAGTRSGHIAQIRPQ